MTFSAAGDLFGVFRSDGSAQLWRVPSGESIASFQLGSFWDVTGIAISPDDAFIGVTGEHSELAEGKLIVRSTGIKRFPPAIPTRTGFFLFSPDGRYLTASLGNVKLFNPRTGKLVATVESSRISRIKTWDDGSFGRNFSYSADGSHIATITGKADDTIRLWNVRTRTTDRLLAGHTQQVSAVELSADGQSLFSSSFDGTVRVWDTASGKQKTIMKGNGLGYYALFVSPDAKKVVAPDVDGELWLWDAVSGAQLARWGGFIERITSAAFSPDGRNIAIGSWSETVNWANPWPFDIKPHILRIWSREDNTFRAITEKNSTNSNFYFGVTGLAYNRDGTILSAVTYSNPLKYETVGLRLKTPFMNKLAEHIDEITSDGEHFIALGYEPNNWTNGILNVYRMNTLERVASLNLPNRQLDAVTSSPDGRLLAVNTNVSGTERSSDDNPRTLILFDITSKQVIQQISATSKNMQAVAISHDNRIIATGGQGGTIDLWDVPSGTRVNTISELYAEHLMFNADDSLLFAVTYKGVDIYDVQKREKLHHLDVGLAPFLTFSRDGTLLATGAEDGTVKVWAIGDKNR